MAQSWLPRQAATGDCDLSLKILYHTWQFRSKLGIRVVTLMKSLPEIRMLFLICIFAFTNLHTLAQKESVLYPIEESGKFGYIDENGKVAIKPQFDDAKFFFEGLARVKIGKKSLTTSGVEHRNSRCGAKAALPDRAPQRLLLAPIHQRVVRFARTKPSRLRQRAIAVPLGPELPQTRELAR